MFKNGYCVVCGRKVKNESMCNTCFSYEMKLAERDAVLQTTRTQLENGQSAWVKILENKNRQVNRLLKQLKNHEQSQKELLTTTLKQVQKDINTEATTDGYVDAVWVDRYITNIIDKLNRE